MTAQHEMPSSPKTSTSVQFKNRAFKTPLSPSHTQLNSKRAAAPRAKRPKFVEKVDVDNPESELSSENTTKKSNTVAKLELEDDDEESIGLQDGIFANQPTFTPILYSKEKSPRPEAQGATYSVAENYDTSASQSLEQYFLDTQSESSYCSKVERNVRDGKVAKAIEESRSVLIRFLHRHYHLEAGSLYQLLVDLGKTPLKRPLDNERLESLLETYVVAHRGTAAKNFMKMPQSHLLLCNHTGTTEAFLTDVFKALKSKAEFSTLNAEIHIGPWYDLAVLVGRPVVTFILLHFHIFKPHEAKPQQWIHLAGTLDYCRNNARQYGRSEHAGEEVSVSKADIMYKKRQPNLGFRYPTVEADTSSYHGGLLQLIRKAEKRLSQYRRLVSRGKITEPAPKSDKQLWSPRKEVVRFMKGRLSKLLPIGILGSRNNWLAFEKHLASFLAAPGFRKLLLKPMMKGIKLSQVPWLKDDSSLSFSEKQRHMESCILWIYDYIVKPIVAHHFYLTEISGKTASLYYFLQSVYISKLELPAKKELIIRHNALNLESTQENSSSPTEEVGSFPVHSLRVLPKPDGSSRPIVNLKEFNKTIKEAHYVLQHLLRSDISRLNSWQSWISRLYDYRNRVSQNGQLKRKYYIVEADITGCYDNANVVKLKEIVSEVLNHGRNVYRLQPARQYLIGSDKLQFREMVSSLPLMGEPVISDADAAVAAYDGPRDVSIISEYGKGKLIEGDQILEDVNRLLNNLKIRVSRDKYISFCHGIPQGAACSLDLCNLLLDDLVSEKLKKFKDDQQSLLLRYVDDFIFISTDPALAQQFQETMIAGFQDEYGARCNPNKIVSTIDRHPNRVRSIVFLGTRIDAATLDVYPRILPAHFSAIGNISLVKRRLDHEINMVLSLLRPFSRDGRGISPPRKLLRQVARAFGLCLASRLDVYHRLLNRKQKTSVRRAYQQVVNRCFMRLVPKNYSNSIRRIIRLSYLHQQKANTEASKDN